MVARGCRLHCWIERQPARLTCPQLPLRWPSDSFKNMNAQAQPSPDLFFDVLTAYQKTAALKAAIDLNLFTSLADSPATAAHIAKTCNAAERGVRILSDYLTVQGFLQKSGDKYSLTLDSAVFLSRKSPGYAGAAVDFLLSDHLTTAFKHLTDSVRRGGTAEPQR